MLCPAFSTMAEAILLALPELVDIRRLRFSLSILRLLAFSGLTSRWVGESLGEDPPFRREMMELLRALRVSGSTLRSDGSRAVEV